MHARLQLHNVAICESEAEDAWPYVTHDSYTYIYVHTLDSRILCRHIIIVNGYVSRRRNEIYSHADECKIIALGTYDQSSWNSDERYINFIRELCTLISECIHTPSVKRPLDWFNGDIIYSRLLRALKNHLTIMTWLYHDIIISWITSIVCHLFSRTWKRTVFL